MDYSNQQYGGGGGGGYHGGGGYDQHQVPHSPGADHYNDHEYDHEYEHEHEHGEQGGGQQSMTIDEMRILHRTALAEAEAKRTELRLVLASRYRELVGSSDEVIHMRERAEELNDLVLALPELVEKVGRSADAVEEMATSGAGASTISSGEGGCSSRKLLSETSIGSSGDGDADNGGSNEKCSPQDADGSLDSSSLAAVRAEISRLPRGIHQCLDSNDVHGAAAALIALFDIIASRSGNFPLATALSGGGGGKEKDAEAIQQKGTRTTTTTKNSPVLETQMKMVYLHVQTLPSRTVKLARRALLQSAAKRGMGAHATAAALSALDLLDIDRRKMITAIPKSISGGGSISSNNNESSRATKLIDLYYESKALLLNKLLNRLTLPSSVSAAEATSVTNAAEVILSKIVLILQYDVILHPYQIFVLRKFPVNNGGDSNEGEGEAKKSTTVTVNAQVINSIMSTLPPRFDPDLLKSKASRFLAAHLPLIRTKVKSVLMIIAGTTASKLGQIRQTLYDKTDGLECMTMLDESGVCTWDEAVGGMVDIRVVSHGTTFASKTQDDEQPGGRGGMNNGTTNNSTQSSSTTTTTSTRRFSLWGALFSNTFSSLVHSLLTSSFHSVHVRVVSTLRTSLARAPPFEYMLPHEAHRNALRIATDLDASLRRVSDDAHELLVHAEEREESERRLRQSLYVQTCEIMGRLLNELRRMLMVGGRRRGSLGLGDSEDEKEDATKVLIVGRLCHLLKFRLKSLPTLLDPKSSPAVLAAGGLGGGKSSGMITLMELSSSFDLADDDDDGLISFDEAMEAMESAFSGTHFHGAQMVRDTLLLAHSSATASEASTGVTNHAGGSFSPNGTNKSAPQNVTLSELALLSARGLRHDASGSESALGTVQSSLDDIVHRCFREWARAALSPQLKSFTTTLKERIAVASTVSDLEWKRLNGLIDKEDDDLLKELNKVKGDESKMESLPTTVGEVSPYVVSYLLAVAGVLNRSVCPADSLPPVPSLEYADRLGMDKDKDIPNMMVTIRGSLLGEALTSVSQSLNGEIISTSDEEYDNNGNDKLKKCSPSSLVQLTMDVQFLHQCFFKRNAHGFSSLLLKNNTAVDDSQRIMEGLSDRLSVSMKDALQEDGASLVSISSAISGRHSQVFNSCDLFLSALFGEDDTDKFSSSAINGGMSSSSQSFILNPLPSSRRFILLPIQAEKSLTELQLRGKYGKKSQEEKNAASSRDNISGNALGAGFGFLSSMLTKTR